MKSEYSVSIIVPAYNSEKTIQDSLSRIIEESKKIKSEILVVDDKSTDKTREIVKKFNDIKLIELEKNQGAGNARNIGAEQAKFEILCFIDSDIEISENSILNLVNRLYKDEETGSVAATQNTINLNKKSWSSNFVCLKSCYGIDEIQKEKFFSSICSEFCVISKKLFNQIDKWKVLYDAGGEEFDLGYKIRQLNKKNIKLKSACYSGYWCSLYVRFKRIIHRTAKYIPLLLKKKKFDTKGTFATFNQVLSSFFTLFIILHIFISYFFYNSYLVIGLIILFILQLFIELNFLKFAKKIYGFKMVIFSFFAIHVINLGILLGVIFYIYKNTINLKLNR